MKRQLKRALSLLLAMTLVFGLFPTGVMAVNDVIQVGTAQELAGLGGQAFSNTNIVLTADLDMAETEMEPIRSLYQGTLDGGGHTISNMTISGSDNLGLVGELSSNARITGVNMENCSVTLNGGSYKGAGILVGKVTGSHSVVDSCSITGGTVTVNSSSAEYAGGLVGYVSTAATISGCFSTAEVTAGSSYSSCVGGLSGFATGGTAFENCYTRGTVNAGSTYAGGLVGKCSGSYSAQVTLENCYTSVDVIGTATNQYPLAYAYNYTEFTNCLFDSTKVAKTTNNQSGTQGKTTDELMAAADSLGGAYQEDLEVPVNAGYPILKWQDPNATYDYELTVTPADALVTWDGLVQDQVQDGVYNFTGLASGSQHTYLVEQRNETDDYAPQEGTVTIGKTNGAGEVTLAANRYELSFTISPENAELTVTDGEGTVLNPENGHTYSVINGTYSYSAKLFGYEDVTSSVEVFKAGQTVNVVLSAQPMETVTFQYGQEIAGSIQNGSITVTTGDHTMEPTDGTTYELPMGFVYTYTFKSANYAKQTGTIDLTGGTAGSQVINIPLVIKTAWGGADDIQKPVGAGTETDPYLISSGAELAWLAQQVCAGSEQNASCVLTKDIDLGDEEWTPIGTPGWSGNPFEGTLDGAGHVIKNLFIDSTSSGQGLISVANGALIKDLTVQGQVAGDTESGGLLGEVKGDSEILRCVSEVTVSGTNNVGGLVGKVTGRTPVIRQCINRGSVTANNSAGGIAGYLYYGCSVESCYNIGAIQAVVSKAGGITGYSNDGNAQILNCYSVGSVDAPNNACGIVGMHSDGTVKNCYYLDTLPTDNEASGKSVTEMKDPAFAAILGLDFQKDMEQPINGGFPILTWQDTTPRYDVVLTVPEDTQLLLTDADGTVVAAKNSSGGVYTFSLTDGSYTYTITGFGYAEKEGTLTVLGADIHEELSPELLPRQNVIFAVTPAEAANIAKITVTLDGTEMKATQDPTVYSLPEGVYDYTVKAKGFVKVLGTVTVADTVQTVNIPMEVSMGWDGESLEPIVPEGNVYTITDGAELAWFAQEVNNGNGRYWDAVLTADIDLGENPWTPIGDYKMYSGIFDGQGHKISGLLVENPGDYAGLFGHVLGDKAKISGLVVEGTVSGSKYTGGIVAQLDDGTVENCGSLVNVTGSGNWSGGVVGRVYSGGEKINGCYNMGTVVGAPGRSAYAGGILGCDNGWKPIIFDCYNLGTVSCDGYAGGITSKLSGTVQNCYNAGLITGGDTQAVVCSGGTVTDCYYLQGTGTDSRATEKTEAELQGLTTTLNGERSVWKQVPGVNNLFPILSWQNDKAPEPEKVSLPAVTGARWMADEDGGLTTVATWNAVENAESYTLVLWKYAMEQQGEYTPDEEGTAGGSVSLVYHFTPVYTQEGLTETQLDLGTQIANSGTAAYCISVTPIAAEESDYVSGIVPQDEQELKELKLVNIFAEGTLYTFTQQLPAPQHLRFIDTRASWDEVPGADSFNVTLYTLDEAGNTVFSAAASVAGDQISMDCRNFFTVGNSYVFTVVAACADTEKNSDPSLFSNDPNNRGHENGVYTVESLPQPEPGEDVDRTDWIPISTASQWVELANISASAVVLPDGTQTDEQAIQWAKKYYLTEDLDFSQLTAEENTKTKSIGNVTNRFNGILDGNGHTITGLTLSNNDAGLFGYIGGNGNVYDLTISEANVLFSDNAAVIAYSNKGTIRNCGVVNCNITADTGAVLGGFVSRNYGIITDSYVAGGTLTSNSDKATGHAGFAGALEEGGRIFRCWSSMDVTTGSEYAGGFVGLGYGGVIRDCFSLGDVNARSYSGGFAGRSVYSGGTYENCYAAGIVTGEESHGFIGGSKPDSAFQPDLSKEIKNCYYNAESPADPFAEGKTAYEMQAREFLSEINRTGAWAQSVDRNNGLPFITTVKAPEEGILTQITVTIALATYDKEDYTFSKMGQMIPVTLESTGNTRVVDVMDAAQEQGLLTYSYSTSPEFGRFIHTINEYSIEAPDGWMFTINNVLSNNGASTARVYDGSNLLWFEGTTENRFLPPLWEDLDGMELKWWDIENLEQLRALTESRNDEALSRNYRLTADLDLHNINFMSIGTEAHPYTGVFDGQGHTVSNISIHGTNNVGFFGTICGATVKNLNLKNVNIVGTQRVGGLVGYAQATLSTTDLTQNRANLLGNCTVSGAVSGAKQVGGLVGLNDGQFDPDTMFSTYSSVNKCAANVEVTAQGIDPEKLGGLAGENLGNITSSYAVGDVKAPQAAMVGGLAGACSGSIYDSWCAGNTEGSRTVGGFAGSCSGNVKNSFSLGNVIAAENAGSFAGSAARADYVIGAGQITVKGSSTVGGIGGFAGTLTGTLTGVANSITVKDAYGNAMGTDGKNFPAIGNRYNYPGESNEAVMKTMELVSKQEVDTKLTEMFDFGSVLAVEEKIAAIGTVTLESSSEIEKAQNAYRALSKEQQLQVRNTDTLEKAQETLEDLRTQQTNQKAAEAVQAQIAGLGEITLDSKSAVEAARKSYDGLTPVQQEMVSNIQTLLDAEQTLKILQVQDADRKAALAVQSQIEALQPITLNSGDAVVAARKSYDGLTVAQRELVTNVQSLLDAESLMEKLLTPNNYYQDVAEGMWYYEAAEYVTDRGIMDGMAEGRFIPAYHTSRGMVASVLYRLAGSPKTEEKNEFEDVAKGRYYTQAIAWTDTTGIMSGYGGGQFGPEDPITREQLATVLYRFAEHQGYNTQERAEFNGFTDEKNISGWAREGMSWAVAQKLVQGMTPTTLEPCGPATRAQLAEVLMRYMETVVE